MKMPKRVAERVNAALKRLKPIIDQQRSRDVAEADTVMLVKDVLNDALGYDKYTDLTSEHQIRGTYCDIAIKVGEKIAVVVECKAIGIPLDDKHVKQAVDYAANEGVEWVILTNGVAWRVYAVIFAKPIDKKLVAEIDILEPDYTKPEDAEQVYLLTKEALTKGDLRETFERQQAFNRHMLAALLLHNEELTNVMRRELRRVSSVNVDPAEITDLLRDEVVKRTCLEGQEADEAARRVNEMEGVALRTRPKKQAKNTAESAGPEVG